MYIREGEKEGYKEGRKERMWNLKGEVGGSRKRGKKKEVEKKGRRTVRKKWWMGVEKREEARNLEGCRRGGVYEKKVVRKRRNGRWGAGLLGSKKRKGEWVR